MILDIEIENIYLHRLLSMVVVVTVVVVVVIIVVVERVVVVGTELLKPIRSLYC
jgi:hypothetical protein